MTVDEVIDGLRELYDDFDRKWGSAKDALDQKKAEYKVIEKKMEEYENVMSLLLEAEKKLIQKGGK